MCLIYGFYKPNYLLIFCFICKKNHLFFFIKKSHFELVRRSFKSTNKLDVFETKKSKHMGQHPLGPVHSESIYTVNGPIVIYIIGVIYNYIVFNLMGNDERKRGEFFYKKKLVLFKYLERRKGELMGSKLFSSHFYSRCNSREA